MRICSISIPTNKLITNFNTELFEQKTKIDDLKHYAAQLRKCKLMLDNPKCNKERIEKCIENNKHLITTIHTYLCEKRIQAIRKISPYMQRYKENQQNINQKQR